MSQTSEEKLMPKYADNSFIVNAVFLHSRKSWLNTIIRVLWYLKPSLNNIHIIKC